MLHCLIIVKTQRKFQFQIIIKKNFIIFLANNTKGYSVTHALLTNNIHNTIQYKLNNTLKTIK